VDDDDDGGGGVHHSLSWLGAQVEKSAEI